MMLGSRYGRPKSPALLAMMMVNGVVVTVLMFCTLHVFGIREIVVPMMLQHVMSAVKWDALWPLIPGAAIAYGCLWFWLVILTRSRSLPWAGACVYGMAIALINVPMSGMVIGLLHGNPLLYLLMGLVNLLMLPNVLCAMVSFGLAMGILNGMLAQSWVGRQKANS